MTLTGLVVRRLAISARRLWTIPNAHSTVSVEPMLPKR